jgi:UDP-N-acetylmuramyl pentapeptide phosphotransferase/UDP-N-acetylglucosamine-1-phosphate transferase
VGFLWDFFVFPWDFYRISLAFPWYVEGFSAGFLLDIYGIPMIGFLWYVYRISMVFLWDFYSISMGVLLGFYGIPIGFL